MEKSGIVALVFFGALIISLLWFAGELGSMTGHVVSIDSEGNCVNGFTGTVDESGWLTLQDFESSPGKRTYYIDDASVGSFNVMPGVFSTESLLVDSGSNGWFWFSFYGEDSQRFVQNYSFQDTLANCIDVEDTDVNTDYPLGMNFYEKGVCYGVSDYSWSPVIDWCVENSNWLGEFFVNASYGCQQYNYECPNGCLNGACVPGTSSPATDTDAGKDYLVAGNCTGQSNYTWSPVSDFCWNSSLYEFYPSGVRCELEEHDCGSGMLCSGGRCVDDSQSFCIDSDEDGSSSSLDIQKGRNYFAKGNVTNGTVFTDFCASNNITLTEYYCFDSTDAVKTISYNCSRGCDDGKCIGGSTSNCIEKTRFNIGKECGTQSDGCGGILNLGDCASGKICSNGQCVIDSRGGTTDNDGGGPLPKTASSSESGFWIWVALILVLVSGIGFVGFLLFKQFYKKKGMVEERGKPGVVSGGPKPGLPPRTFPSRNPYPVAGRMGTRKL